MFRPDELSTVAPYAAFQKSEPCPDEVHILIEAEDEDGRPYIKRSDTDEAKPSAMATCPVCNQEKPIAADDYICVSCRQKQCPRCGGTKLVGGGTAQPAFMREVRTPINNDLLAQEAEALTFLRRQLGEKKAFVPHFAETRLVDGKRQNIFQDDGWDLYSLEEILQRYPQGIDPKDMAWMFRRLLLVLGLANDAGYAHGAILPSTVFIEPEAHGLVLANWAHSVKRPGRVRSLVKSYRDWYPPEVFARNNVLAGTDIYMAAKCMEWVMGGQPVPDRIQHFLTGCQNPDAAKRPNNAKEIFDEFNTLLGQVWGARTFHPFTMK